VEILDHSVNWNLSRCWSTGGSTEAKILIASLRASFFKHGFLSRLTQIVEKTVDGGPPTGSQTRLEGITCFHRQQIRPKLNATCNDRQCNHKVFQ
jgi:hypothetical protein